MNTDIRKLKAYLLCRYADQSSLYSSWVDRLPCQMQMVIDDPSTWRAPDDAGIVITHEHFRWEEIAALGKLVQQSRIPTLILADGVLEYRNTWQNPTIPDASIYQPLMADKIACIGNNSARMIESWGNLGKTEVVGLPRLDALLNQQRQDQSSGSFRLLIATATTPAFTQQQRETVMASLKALQGWAQANPTIGGRELEICWRLTDGLDQDLGIESANSDRSLHQELQAVDAAITTPSTIYLESCLLKVPTAVLDFSNSPAFVPAAWTITAAEHVDTVVRELSAPPAAKMLFQDFVLHDNLSCQTPATDRMIELVTRMIEFGHLCRSNHQPLSFPPHILENPSDPTARLNLAQLFPDNSAFRFTELERLQAELSQAVFRLNTMPLELADKNQQIAQLQMALDESRRRVADVRSRLFKLRKILGIGKENQTEEVTETTD